MAVKDKIQCPIRLYESDYKKIKEKAVLDRLNFQKIAELLLLEYLKGNKEIQKVVTKYAEERSTKKRRGALDEMEAKELLRLIEEEHSPLRHMQNLSREIKEEDGQNLHNRNRF